MKRPDPLKWNDPEAYVSNISAVKRIAEFSAKTGAFFITISTDYVFNGTRPPYAEFDKPDPLNAYAESKLLCEKATQSCSRNYAILRVPILYGPVDNLGEGPVDALLKAVLDVSKPFHADHCQLRYPTHVENIASAINLMVRKYLEVKLF